MQASIPLDLRDISTIGLAHRSHLTESEMMFQLIRFLQSCQIKWLPTRFNYLLEFIHISFAYEPLLMNPLVPPILYPAPLDNAVTPPNNITPCLRTAYHVELKIGPKRTSIQSSKGAGCGTAPVNWIEARRSPLVSHSRRINESPDAESADLRGCCELGWTIRYGRGYPGALIAAGAHEALRAWDPAATTYHTTPYEVRWHKP